LSNRVQHTRAELPKGSTTAHAFSVTKRKRRLAAALQNLPAARPLLYSDFAMLDEMEFRRRCDAAMEELRRRLLELGDEHGFEVEGEGEKLEVIFEEPEEAKFVISPNSAVRQIWISALATSFKLGWSDAAGAFVLDKSGETLGGVMSRILSQQLGVAVHV
jgi:CyaY protein